MARNAGNRKMREGKACVLCGGTRPSDTTEHAPPKSMFHNKQRPQGYEFPACTRCNHGTGTLDALASFLFMSGRKEALLNRPPLTKHQQNLARTVSKSFPRIFSSVQNASLRSSGGVVVGQAKRLALTGAASRNLALWSAKQVFAYWYHQNGHPLTSRATVGVRIITNDQTDDDFQNDIAKLLGPGHSMKHAKRYADDQFFYRYVRDSEINISFVQAVFHQNGGFFAVVDEETHHSEVIKTLPHRLQTNKNRGIHSIYPHIRSRVLYGSAQL